MPIDPTSPPRSGGPVIGPHLAPAWTTHTLMLLEAGPDEDIYRHADAGPASGALLAGGDAFLQSRVTRIRRREGGAQIRIHDNPDRDDLRSQLVGRDVRVCIQTATATIKSGAAGNAGGNYANWPFGAAEAALFAAIAEGERFQLTLGEAT